MRDSTEATRRLAMPTNAQVTVQPTMPAPTNHQPIIDPASSPTMDQA